MDPHYSEVRSAEALKSDGDDALRTQQKDIKLYEQGNKPQDEKHQRNHILPAELPQPDQFSQHLHVHIQAKLEKNAEETLKGDGDHKPREENSSGDTDQLEVNKSSPRIKQSESTKHSSSSSSCDTSSRTDTNSKQRISGELSDSHSVSSQQETGGDSEDENYSDQTADNHSFSSISSRHVAESVSNRTSINSDTRLAKREHESEDKAFSTQQVIHQPAKKTDSFFD